MDLADVLGRLFVPAVRVAAGALRLEAPLGPRENMRMRNAHPRRRIEFASGRYYAREALAEFGLEAPDIDGDVRYGPDWPAPVVGSISHTNSFAAAVVGSKRSALSLGLDIEAATPLPDRLVDKVCLPSERAMFASAPSEAARFIFVMKEAAYKAYAPIMGIRLGFHDVEVRADWTRQSFVALVNEREGQSQCSISGRFARHGNLLTAGCWLSRTLPAL